MTAGMIYALLVGVALAAAAALLEEPVRRAGGSVRHLWLGALVATALVPVALWFAPLAPPPGAPAIPVILRDANGVERRAAPPTPVANSVASHPFPAFPFARFELSRFAMSAWTERLATVTMWTLLCGPVLVFAALVLDSVRFARRRRAWIDRDLDEERLSISSDFGPAIVGLIRPRIVVPEWVTELSAVDRAFVVRHEREHLRANDPRVLALAYLAVAATPWNPVVWWQLRRLRLAIELDCDRRVLAGESNAAVGAYASLLIETNRRMRPTGMSSIFTSAFAERGQSLHHRIVAMTESPASILRAPALARVVVVGVLGLCLAAVRPPTFGDVARGVLVRAGGVSLDVDVTSLAPLVGDSILPEPNLSEHTHGADEDVPIAEARNLPARFVAVAESQNSDHGWSDTGCPSELVDPRDSTHLHIIGSAYVTMWVKLGTGDSLSGIDTRVGYYFADSTNRYGVASRQRLRVGCGAPAVPIPITGAEFTAISDALQFHRHLRPKTITRLADVLTVQLQARSTDPDPAERSPEARAIARVVWRFIPDTAGVTTVRVSFGTKGRSVSWTYDRQSALREDERSRREPITRSAGRALRDSGPSQGMSSASFSARPMMR